MEGIRLTDKIFKDTYYWIFEGYEIRFNLDSLEVEGTDVIEKQDTENLHLESQGIENQGQLNTYISNTKESSTKECNAAVSVLQKSSSKKKVQDNKKNYAEAVTMTEEEYQKLTQQHTKAFVDKLSTGVIW